MVVKLFLIGRPGCGKSSAAKHISNSMRNKGWKTKRFKDFDILQAMTQEEQYKQKFKAVRDEGFDVVDNVVLIEALTRLNVQLIEYLRQAQTNELLLIEFARDDYEEALKHFSSDILQDAYFIFIDAKLETCIRRIEQRMVNPIPPDDHHISKEMLFQYYTNQKFPVNSVSSEKFNIVDNNDGTLQDFTMKVNNIVANIFK